MAGRRVGRRRRAGITCPWLIVRARVRNRLIGFSPRLQAACGRKSGSPERAGRAPGCCRLVGNEIKDASRRGCRSLRRFRASGRLFRHPPETDAGVPARGQGEPAVGREGHVPHLINVSRPAAHFPAGVHLPEANGLVVAARKGNAFHRAKRRDNSHRRRAPGNGGSPCPFAYPT